MRRFLFAVSAALLCAGFLCFQQAAAQFGAVKPIVAACGGPGGNDSFTKLLVHFDGANASTAVNDSSPTNKGAATRVGSALAITTATSVFGGASLGGGTNADGNYYTFPNSADYAFGTGDFTIDFRGIKRSNNFGGFAVWYLGTSPTFGNGWSIRVGQSSGDSVDYVEFYIASGGSFPYVWVWSPAIGTIGAGWNHFALVRSGGVFSGYMNGTARTPNTVTGNPAASIPGAGDVLRINGTVNAGGNAGGMLNVDEMRISSNARWTSNFTPPTQAYCPNWRTGT